MSARILDGRAAAEALLANLKPKVQELDPKLVIVQVGEDPASASYIRQKLKSCEKIGMRAEHKHLKETVSHEELLKLVQELNADPDVTGFIVQLPLPKHLAEKLPEIIRAIDPKKDVDGFGAYNLGKMFLSREFEHLPPATPAGIVALLEYDNVEVAGRHAVIVGRSNTVGKPLAIMLLNRDATVTVCHSRTKDLGLQTLEADILIAAVGKPKLITKEMVKPGAVVIDVGINEVSCHAERSPELHRGTETKHRIVGDVDFDEVSAVAFAITPVPGGVGPMTVASLLRNVVRAKERQMEKNEPCTWLRGG